MQIFTFGVNLTLKGATRGL